MRVKLSGFAFGETLIALMIVSIAGLLVVQSSGTNAVVRTKSVSRAAAARLATELSEWARRRGLQWLDLSAGDLLAAIETPAYACHDGDCNSVQGARHYLYQWRARLLRAIPGVRAEVCIDYPPGRATVGWACVPEGRARVLKMGWPPYPGVIDFLPTLMLQLEPVD